MKTQFIFLAMTALLLGTACGSPAKDQSAESAQSPAPVVAQTAPAPAPTPEAPTTDIQACEGKAAKDPCSYTGDKGEVKGACVRTETQALQCQPKKSKKK